MNDQLNGVCVVEEKVDRKIRQSILKLTRRGAIWLLLPSSLRLEGGQGYYDGGHSVQTLDLAELKEEVTKNLKKNAKTRVYREVRGT